MCDRPQVADILRKAIFQIRKQVFRELCMKGDSLFALKYLQTDVGSVVNHDDHEESTAFRRLTTWLFQWSGENTGRSLEEKSDAGLWSD